MSSGTPGLTNEAFICSVPRSMPRTAEEAAEAVEAKRKRKESMKDTLDSRRRLSRGIVRFVTGVEKKDEVTKEIDQPSAQTRVSNVAS